MPDPVRIGVIGASDPFFAWQRSNNISGAAVWNIRFISDIYAMRTNRWFINSLICLPGWRRNLRDAEAILDGARTLIVRSSSRESGDAPVEEEENEPAAPTSPPLPDGSPARDFNIRWLVDNASLPGATREVFNAATDRELELLNGSIQLRDMAAGRDSPREFMRWSDTVNQTWNRIRDRANNRPTPTILAPPLPAAPPPSEVLRTNIPFGDVLRTHMRELMEQAQPDGTLRRRRRTI